MLVGLAGASAVLLGAFGAHALRATLDAAHYELWHTAVEYHFWHALALAVAVLFGRQKASRVAVLAFTLGIVMFSGSLYALALGAMRWVGIVTPIGGLAFLAGWIALGFAVQTQGDRTMR
ncbi:membrane protein [Dyella lipolytica]|nr:membrane protein [Dyella lipolytica]